MGHIFIYLWWQTIKAIDFKKKIIEFPTPIIIELSSLLLSSLLRHWLSMFVNVYAHNRNQTEFRVTRVGTFEVCVSTHVALRVYILPVLASQLHFLTSIETLNSAIIQASQSYESRETCCTAEWLYGSIVILWFVQKYDSLSLVSIWSWMCRNSVVNVIEIEKEFISTTVTTCLRPYGNQVLSSRVYCVLTNSKVTRLS